MASDQVVPCDGIAKRGAVSRSSSARKVVESDGCHQSGGSVVIGTKLDRSGTDQARCLVTRTPPSRNGGSDVVKRLMGKTN